MRYDLFLGEGKMAKKKLDFKALLLNHGEKFGAAVVGLLALTGLATANW